VVASSFVRVLYPFFECIFLVLFFFLVCLGCALFFLAVAFWSFFFFVFLLWLLKGLIGVLVKVFSDNSTSGGRTMIRM
jgi:hypothetical protein